MTDITRRQFTLAAATLPLAGLLPKVKSESTYEFIPRKDFHEFCNECYASYPKIVKNEHEEYWSPTYRVMVPEEFRFFVYQGVENHCVGPTNNPKILWGWGDMLLSRKVYFYRGNLFDMLIVRGVDQNCLREIWQGMKPSFVGYKIIRNIVPWGVSSSLGRL